MHGRLPGGEADGGGGEGGHCDHRHREQERGDAGQHGQDEERVHCLQHGPQQHGDRRVEFEDSR